LHAMAQVAQLTGHPGRVGSVAVSHDGRRAVTGGQDGIVRVWDLNAMAQTGHLAGHTGWVVSAAMSPAVASSAAGVPLWACGPAGCGRGVQAVVVRI
jgi:WD40 repeat protein